MQIQHNLPAKNSYRNLVKNRKGMAENLEKLSSGFRINRAADDASGLAISEDMRERIRGLDQGLNNIDDGISFIETADGAMDEVTKMLQRINKLSIQAVNGTYHDDAREDIQLEINELKKEIQRISEETTFNDIPVFQSKIEEPKEVVIKSYTHQLPSWLKDQCSAQMAAGNVTDGGYTQDSTPYFVREVSSTPATYEYYGPDEKYAGDSSYTYLGQWTPELNDNLSAVIDFSGLITKYDGSGTATAQDLYRDIYSLLGTSIAAACATCMDSRVAHPIFYGVAFYGSAVDPDSGLVREYSKDDMRYSTTFYASNNVSVTGNTIDLGKLTLSDDSDTTILGYLDYLKSSNADPATLADAAKTIANRLYEKTYEKLSDYVKATDHYNRLLNMNTDGETPAFAIYDYRDNTSLSPAPSSVQLFTSTSGKYKEYPDNRSDLGKLWIQCSSVQDDRVAIDQVNLGLRALGIEDYDITRYEATSTPVYSPESVAAQNDPNNYVETVHKYTHPVIVGTTTNSNGETINITEPRENSYTTRDYVGPPLTITGYSETKTYAPSSISDITDAIDKVSGYRAILGAKQNRLEHSRSNDEIMNENITASESRIRDTDMAKEIAAFTKNNILSEAAQAMLSQANQTGQGVLSLLR
ncbi:flagellin [[Clostridium] aminophilum]|uniref:Flagellin n=1 Tax=[Clostridium] aminophilum TaxID=1526 RepID=A0A1I0HBB6_9FIRM|nr:flagellin [[Clostridium] aminophilum]SET81076.1 flagellin [[Clostridium] aminophilum]